MYVDAFNLDAVNWSLEDAEERKGDLRGKSVSILNQIDAMPNSVIGQLHQSAIHRENCVGLKPYMQFIREVEIGVDYIHTNPDGSSDTIGVKGKATFDRERDKEARTDNDNTKTKDIDSRDRDRDRDRG